MGDEANVDPFKRVTFRTEYPPKRVADHEVCMSFPDDDTAKLWHEWWNVVGAEDFERYRRDVEKNRKRQHNEGEKS
jgi:hypothetical protein